MVNIKITMKRCMVIDEVYKMKVLVTGAKVQPNLLADLNKAKA